MNPDPVERQIAEESPYARQLRAGFPWLAFEPDLEAEFRHHEGVARLPRIRTNLLLAGTLILISAALNELVLPAGRHLWLYAVQFGLLLPVVAFGFVVARHPNGARLYPRVASVLAPIVGLGFVAIELEAARRGVPYLFAATILVTLSLYYLAGLFFYPAVRACAIVWVGYVAFSVAGGGSGKVLVYHAALLLIANVIGAIVAYGLEQVVRTHFLESRLLSETAARDGLTGIYNRRRLDEHLDTVWQSAQREGVKLALLLVDIDHFKRYNDRHGHQAGDECLRSVATSLVRAARRPLDFVARYGGEEFAVVLYDPSREYLREIANRIHATVATAAIPHANSPVSTRVTVSIGAAHVAPTLERTSHGFVQLADEALYDAKAEGRNRTAFREAEYSTMRTGMFNVRDAG